MSVYYNDITPFCCEVLREGIARGTFHGGRVDERDIRTVTADDLAGYGQVHLFAGVGGFPLAAKWAGLSPAFPVLTGGFPCQDISTANAKGAGIDGARSGLWREMFRIIRALRPRYVVVENSPRLLSRGMGRVLGDLASVGFAAEWEVLSACAFGASHVRERLFVVAYPDGQRLEAFGGEGNGNDAGVFDGAERARHLQAAALATGGGHGLAVAREPGVARVADGIPDRTHRNRALGNAVVPQVLFPIFKAIMRMDGEAVG